jgi:hypothetical protein
MTQTRYHNYGSAQGAWTDAQQFLGVLTNARYRGFDGFTATNATTITITHTNNRALKSPAINGILKPNTGIWVTTQGVIIAEDASIAGLNNAALNNTLGTFQRIIAVYGEHEFTQVVGGASAIYGLKPGDTSGNYPTLDFPLKQTILAYIIVPAGQSATGPNVKIELPRIPGLGNEYVATKDWENTFDKLQQWNQDSEVQITATSKLELGRSGNTFAVNMTGDIQFVKRTGYKPGTRVVIQNRNATPRRLFIDLDISSGSYNTTYDEGYSQLKFADGLEDGEIRYWLLSQYDVAVLELVDSGTSRGIYWHLIWVSAFSRSIAQSYNLFPSVDILSVSGYDNTFTEESDTKYYQVSPSLITFPGNLFEPGNPNYQIWAKIQIRLKLMVQVWGKFVPFTHTGTYESYTPKFHIVITKNTTAQPTPTLRSNLGWGAEVLTNEICLDDNSSPLDFEPHFKIVNGEALFQTKPGDAFRVWIYTDEPILRLKVDSLATDMMADITYKPVTRYLG